MVDSRAPYPLQAWQRLTLADLLLLQVSLAIGFSAASTAIGGWRVLIFVFGSWMGMLVWGPLVLLVQWLYRDRWAAPSRGEWLWLCASLLGLGALAATAAVTKVQAGAVAYLLGAPVISLWVAGQILCAGIAVMDIVRWVQEGPRGALRLVRPHRNRGRGGERGVTALVLASRLISALRCGAGGMMAACVCPAREGSIRRTLPRSGRAFRRGS